MSGGDDVSVESIDRDRQHFMRTLASFKFFGVHMQKRVEKSVSYFHSFAANHRSLIPEYEKSMEKVRTCITRNDELIAKIIEHSAPDMFSRDNGEYTLDTVDHSGMQMTETKRLSYKSSKVSRMGPFAFTTSDMDKIRSTLKQFVRDWSSLGKRERDVCYQPVIDEIGDIYRSSDPIDVHILVPGAGLGRLAWELAHRGYTCQGNEWSLHMLIPAYFILNTCTNIDEHTIYPWVTQFCNNMSRSDQLTPVQFPDVCPADIPPHVPFSMAAGDFVEIYTEPDIWDCVATVFFIDTAHNILSYLETIWRILKPGGFWINFGPLLYHFSDVPGEESLELSHDELVLAIQRIGFETIKLETGIRCGYTQNPASMLSYEYSCVYGVFRKPTGSR